MKEKNQHCSFCGRSKTELSKLIVGEEAAICAECVDFCKLSMQVQAETAAEVATEEIRLATPREICRQLDEYVVGQEAAKKALSVAVYNHYKRLFYEDRSGAEDRAVELSKSNILLIGPTGSGKTLLAETLARSLNVPFAIADATTLTEAGYVGDDVETVIQRLLQNCDYDVKKAEKGIVYIDEIDKIARKGDSPSITRDVSGEGVQQALLKIVEGTLARIPLQGSRKHPQQDCLQVNTKNILFICGGAFANLGKIIQERSEKSSIGFSAELFEGKTDGSLTKLMRQVEPEDLIKFGLIPEFVGRLPVVTVLDELVEAELVRILTEPKNALIKQYRKLFRMEEVELEFTEAAVREIAKKSVAKKTGARGLRSIIEDLLLDTMHQLPSDGTLAQVRVDEEVVNKLKVPICISKKQGV